MVFAVYPSSWGFKAVALAETSAPSAFASPAGFDASGWGVHPVNPPSAAADPSAAAVAAAAPIKLRLVMSMRGPFSLVPKLRAMRIRRFDGIFL